MTKIAIFDLDGTLLNTIFDLGAACNHALSQFGFPLHDAQEYPNLVGNGVNRLIERALPEGHKTEDNVLKLREVFIPYYDTHNKVHTFAYEGISELLQYMKKSGWLMAVASNKYQAAAEDMVEHYFPKVFDVVFGERVGCPRKPDPQIVNDILIKLGVILSDDERRQVLYVGDSDVDMKTAINAGLTAVACTWGFCDRDTLEGFSPQFVVTHPLQIQEIIEGR